MRTLIRQGEGDRLDFKSTLRGNLRTDRADKAIRFAVLMTVVAFLNTDGGTLLIGVQDDGTLLGIEVDRFENDDKFMLHFNNLLKTHLGLEHARRTINSCSGSGKRSM